MRSTFLLPKIWILFLGCILPSAEITAVPWPSGTYGLIKTRSGCPGNQVDWQSGWRYQDTEDHDASNRFSYSIESYLEGYFGGNIRTDFCIKTASNIGSRWPEGSYCILKYGNCPYGFKDGYIYWDDEDYQNTNDKWGFLPDGIYDGNTRIEYCCRKDGLYTQAITLPTDHPFVLMRFGGTCQLVQGMGARDLFIRWDCEDWTHSSSAGGWYPDDTDIYNHELHFCYYQ